METGNFGVIAALATRVAELEALWRIAKARVDSGYASTGVDSERDEAIGLLIQYILPDPSVHENCEPQKEEDTQKAP